ncbi:MAG: hypothetical protein ACJ74O_17755 [Frankiaceae bacterium]
MARERHIRVTAEPKAEPDVRLYVLALIALARQLDEEQQGAAEPPSDAGEPGGAA